MKRSVTVFVQFIGFLFAAFGGFLTDIAPPAQTNPKFAVGLSSFLALMTLLAVSAIGKTSPAGQFRKRWIIAGVICFALAVTAGLIYPWMLNRLTYPYPPPPDAPEARHVNGWILTDTATDFIKRNPGTYSPGQLELKLPYEEIWTADSVAKAEVLLLLSYLVLVLSISVGIFCLLEARSKTRSASKVVPRKRQRKR